VLKVAALIDLLNKTLELLSFGFPPVVFRISTVKAEFGVGANRAMYSSMLERVPLTPTVKVCALSTNPFEPAPRVSKGLGSKDWSRTIPAHVCPPPVLANRRTTNSSLDETDVIEDLQIYNSIEEPFRAHLLDS
jgi:hypothetical protein